MKRALVLSLGTLGVLAVGFLYLAPLGAGTRGTDILEEQVTANLMRVRVNGVWEEFPLMPLADHLCKTPDRLFEKYCGDEVMTPVQQ